MVRNLKKSLKKGIFLLKPGSRSSVEA